MATLFARCRAQDHTGNPTDRTAGWSASASFVPARTVSDDYGDNSINTIKIIERGDLDGEDRDPGRVAVAHRDDVRRHDQHHGYLCDGHFPGHHDGRREGVGHRRDCAQGATWRHSGLPWRCAFAT